MQKTFHKSGFTLIELILGIGIFSVVIASIYATFFSGISLSRRSHQEQSFYRELRWFTSLLQKDLDRMVFYDFKNSYKDLIAFHGGKDKITFIIVEDDSLKVVSYYLRKPEESKIHQTLLGVRSKKNVTIELTSEGSQTLVDLLRSEMPFVDYLSSQKEESNTIDGEVVLSGVLGEDFGFKFLLVKKELETLNSSWVEDWKENGLPSSMKLHFSCIVPSKNKRTISIDKDFLILQSKPIETQSNPL